jgi:hypothetical protein
MERTMNTRLRDDIEKMIASTILLPATPAGDPRAHLPLRELDRVADLADAICGLIDNADAAVTTH